MSPSSERRPVSSRWLPLVALLATSCVGKAPPARPAGFADAEGMKHNPKLPFHRVWRDRSFDFGTRRHIHVAKINTDYMLGHTWWQGFGRGSKAHADVVELADEFRQLVIAAFREDKARRFTVLDEAALDAHREDALVLELAIVELVPRKAQLHALTYSGGVAGLLARRGLDSLESTQVAMEGRVRDPASGHVVARFADRERKKAGLINIKNFTWYAHVRGILGEWAQQFRQVANKTPEEVIPDTPGWRLLPW